MFIPKEYREGGRAAATAFIRRYPFGVVVTGAGQRPVATHLPFLLMEEGDRLLLRSHMHRGNPQWKEFAAGQALVIFSQPHGYVSPSLYEQDLKVPTWNYLALHAYGPVTLLPSHEQALAIIEATIQTFEPDYLPQFKALPAETINRLIPQLVAFEMEVTEIQFQKKLSQEKSPASRANVTDYFSKSEEGVEKDLGGYMNSLSKS